jgi:hypothetical protein
LGERASFNVFGRKVATKKRKGGRKTESEPGEKRVLSGKRRKLGRKVGKMG